MLFLQIYNFFERKIAALRAYNRAWRELEGFTEADLADFHMGPADISRIADEASRDAEARMREIEDARMHTVRSLVA